jgi:hypothetical protein
MLAGEVPKGSSSLSTDVKQALWMQKIERYLLCVQRYRLFVSPYKKRSEYKIKAIVQADGKAASKGYRKERGG